MKRRGQSSAISENIAAVANLEQEFLRRRSGMDRLVDEVADFTGSLTFVAAHVVWFAAWFIMNAVDFAGIPHFDPYPYTLLSMVVSCEAVILSAIVLMKQNRMGQHADEREHLHLQINMLTEKEVTKVLQTLQMMCKHMGIQDPIRDEEARELTQDTAVDHLAEELREKIHNLTPQ